MILILLNLTQEITSVTVFSSQYIMKAQLHYNVVNTIYACGWL